MEIADKIHCIKVATFTLPPHNTTNCYIIGDRNILLIDGVLYRENSLLKYMSLNHIEAVKYAAITHPHPDHYTGIETLLDRFGARILCHAETGTNLPFNIKENAYFKGGETLKAGDYDVKIIHTPGHSPGHLCFYIEKEGILFSGDTILGRGTSVIAPPEGDMQSYMNSLRLLSGMNIKMICPGHGPVINDYAAQWIQWYIEHRMMREGKIISALGKGPASLSSLTESIYTEEDFIMHGYDLLPRAERTVMEHLIKLEKEGVVSSSRLGGVLKYFLAP